MKLRHYIFIVSLLLPMQFASATIMFNVELENLTQIGQDLGLVNIVPNGVTGANQNPAGNDLVFTITGVAASGAT